jgi:aspartate kinase
VIADADVAKVSVVGVGMRSHAGVAEHDVHARWRRRAINIQVISTSRDQGRPC